MRNYEGIAAAADAARDFMIEHKDSLPAQVVDRVFPHTRTGSSPVDLVCHFTEAAYANRDELPAEALEIAAGIADIISIGGYWGRLEDRVVGIRSALRRDSGEAAPAGSEWPDAADDPAPKSEYQAPAAEEQP